MTSIILAMLAAFNCYESIGNRYATKEGVFGYAIIALLLVVNAWVHWRNSDLKSLPHLWMKKRQLEMEARIRELQAAAKH